MSDLKFEQKRALSRVEAADQLEALATALREGGEAEFELAPVTLSMKIPDELRSEIEVEVGDGEIELEIEFKWSIEPGSSTTAAAPAAAPPKAATGRGRATKRSAAKKS
ncbi:MULTISPECIES: amphi-Trp domain-containing protein [Streptomyces]|uniref:Amphi-Trp domain-containing protein n=1 Tax=Streptomyces solicathayae TaxID=3081768 RepID=A0ABZ0LY42_9ACTN|nr:amphi-Trp domain-containing protein [Streptomyces sp. HUAS YS2]WOX24372.1 amphi-Trp domain-containing protein [Streptomyces sp. HUAS YS2]